MNPAKQPYKWTLQRCLFALWFAGITACVVIVMHPVGRHVLRLLLVVTVPALWFLSIFLIRAIRWMAITLALFGLVTGLFVLLPGRPVDPAKLQSEYLRQLKKYEGTRYVWGGENRRGIDCSGLVRRALVDAHMYLGWTTINPTALRSGFDLWWHDCTARALLEEYRDFTSPVFSAPSINSITNASLMPGDLAVTSNGIHVLAYLGEQKWIEADPNIQSVITLPVPTDNMWFNIPVQVMRWTQLEMPD